MAYTEKDEIVNNIMRDIDLIKDDKKLALDYYTKLSFLMYDQFYEINRERLSIILRMLEKIIDVAPSNIGKSLLG